MPVWLRIISHVPCRGWWRAHAENGVLNRIWLLLRRLAHHNDWSTWFDISSPAPICCPSFSFMGGVAKEYITKLGWEKKFLRSYIEHCWRCSNANTGRNQWWAVLTFSMKTFMVFIPILRVNIGGFHIQRWHARPFSPIGNWPFENLKRYQLNIFWQGIKTYGHWFSGCLVEFFREVRKTRHQYPWVWSKTEWDERKTSKKIH